MISSVPSFILHRRATRGISSDKQHSSGMKVRLAIHLEPAKFIFLLTFLCTISTSYSERRYNCQNSEDVLGETVPRGDFAVQFGHKVEIYCSVNLTKVGNDSSCIFWTIEKNETDVDAKNVHLINSSTAQLLLPVNSPSTLDLDCRCGEKSVCNNRVQIGYPPATDKTTTFKCVFEDYFKVNCSWNTPWNPVTTDWKVEYKDGTSKPENRTCEVKGKYDEVNQKDVQHHCYFINSSKDFCKTSTPITFVLTGKNSLGNSSTTREIIAHQNVLLNPPKNLYLSGGARWLSVTWYRKDLPWSQSVHCVANIEYNVSLFEKKDGGIETLFRSEVVNSKNSSVYLELWILIPYTNYVVKLRTRTIFGKKPLYTSKWGNTIARDFSTLPDVPNRPPEIMAGSFERSSHSDTHLKDVTLFWKGLKKYDYNSAHVKYLISTMKGNLTTNNTWITVRKLFVNELYDFKLYSENQNGTSANYSLISIKMTNDTIQESLNAKLKVGDVIFHDEKSNGHRNMEYYTVKWTYEQSHERNQEGQSSANLTVFWCTSASNHLNNSTKDCDKDGINWRSFGSNESNIRLRLPSSNGRRYIFAVSAIQEELQEPVNTGLVWSNCITRDSNKLVPPKVRDVTNKSLTWIEVVWEEIPCGERPSNILGYNVKVSLKETAPRIYVSNTTKYNITNLTPGTQYAVKVSTRTLTSNSSWSDEMIFETKLDEVEIERWMYFVIPLVACVVLISLSFLGVYAYRRLKIRISELKRIHEGLPRGLKESTVIENPCNKTSVTLKEENLYPKTDLALLTTWSISGSPVGSHSSSGFGSEIERNSNLSVSISRGRCRHTSADSGLATCDIGNDNVFEFPKLPEDFQEKEYVVASVLQNGYCQVAPSSTILLNAAQLLRDREDSFEPANDYSRYGLYRAAPVVSVPDGYSRVAAETLAAYERSHEGDESRIPAEVDHSDLERRNISPLEPVSITYAKLAAAMDPIRDELRPVLPEVLRVPQRNLGYSNSGGYKTIGDSNLLSPAHTIKDPSMLTVEEDDKTVTANTNIPSDLISTSQSSDTNSEGDPDSSERQSPLPEETNFCTNDGSSPYVPVFSQARSTTNGYVSTAYLEIPEIPSGDSRTTSNSEVKHKNYCSPVFV